MSKAPSRTLIIFLALVCVNGNVVQLEGSNLHPVQGLYVKPSDDGTTGDLYVAASEDSGANAHWVADQPVNFLAKPVTYSSSITTSTSPREETITSQRQAVYTSQPVTYTYGGESGNALSPYHYAAPASSAVPASYDYSKMPYFYSYFYPYIMSAAAATAAHALKEAGLSEEMANAVLSHSSTLWQQPAYSYPAAAPAQYAAVDPNAWPQSPMPPTPTPTATPIQQTTDVPNSS